MSATTVPNGKQFAIVLALSYRVDPAAAVVPIPEWRAVVLSGSGEGTNKPLARLPEAGDTPELLLGIVNSGAEEALCGDFPDAAESHISVVEAGTYLIKVADGAAITAGDLIAVDANGEAVALGAGIVDTPWVAKDTIAVSAGHYIRVKL